MKSLFAGLLTVLLAGPAIAQLHVGVASTDITPLPGESMIAMGGTEVAVEQIHDPLAANVIVFKNGADQLAIVSLDLIGSQNMDEIRSGVRERTGIEDVICVVTHTHGSGRSSAAHSARITPLIIAAAAQAQTNLTPARIGFGRGEAQLGYNRRIVQEDGTVEMMWNNRERVPSGPTDPEVGVLLIKEAESDNVIATLVNYAVHPVISMNFSELIISADYPAAMAQQVEKAVGGRCIFFMGAAGDINPFDADMFRYATADEVFAEIKVVGQLLATEVLATIAEIDSFETNPSIDYAQRILPMADRDAPADAPKHRAIEVNTVVLGDNFAMATFPGELFVELGLDLKARSPTDHTWVLGVTNELNWYIPTIKATTEGGYGAAWGTDLEVGAGERMVLEALVSIHHQLGLVKPLQ